MDEIHAGTDYRLGSQHNAQNSRKMFKPKKSQMTQMREEN
jgi:hypothetical protein